jgi:hypothetical protein
MKIKHALNAITVTSITRHLAGLHLYHALWFLHSLFLTFKEQAEDLYSSRTNFNATSNNENQ